MATPIKYNDLAAYKRVEAAVVVLIYEHGRVRQKDRAQWEWRAARALERCCGHGDTVEGLQFAMCVALHNEFPRDVTAAVKEAARGALNAAVRHG